MTQPREAVEAALDQDGTAHAITLACQRKRLALEAELADLRTVLAGCECGRDGVQRALTAAIATSEQLQRERDDLDLAARTYAASAEHWRAEASRMRAIMIAQGIDV